MPGIDIGTMAHFRGASRPSCALNAVLHNKWPSGGSYVRKGTTHAEVTAEFSDGTSVTRI